MFCVVRCITLKLGPAAARRIINLPVPRGGGGGSGGDQRGNYSRTAGRGLIPELCCCTDNDNDNGTTTTTVSAARTTRREGISLPLKSGSPGLPAEIEFAAALNLRRFLYAFLPNFRRVNRTMLPYIPGVPRDPTILESRRTEGGTEPATGASRALLLDAAYVFFFFFISRGKRLVASTHPGWSCLHSGRKNPLFSAVNSFHVRGKLASTFHVTRVAVAAALMPFHGSAIPHFQPSRRDESSTRISLSLLLARVPFIDPGRI